MSKRLHEAAMIRGPNGTRYSEMIHSNSVATLDSSSGSKQ